MEMRSLRSEDLPQVLSILQRSLGWLPDDAHESFFRWKHTENPFGPSPAWVAVDGDTIAGFRTFMRWKFIHSGSPVRAVRAVDTATNPDYRGRGVFSDLTRHALDELRAEGVEFVFNTPNDQSRPGYLKMGWHIVGRLPVRVRPAGPAGLLRLARSRQPAELWSEPCQYGEPAAAVLADDGVIGGLLRAHPTGSGLVTARTAPYLAWRYSFPNLHYRAVLAGTDPEAGLVVFRLRRRGRALEAAVTEVIVPGDEGTTARRLVAGVVAGSGADYAVVLGSAARIPGLVPLRGQGPVLTWRAVAAESLPPALPDWRVSLGDVELF